MAGTDRRGEGGPVLLLLHGSALGVPRRGFLDVRSLDVRPRKIPGRHRATRKT